MAGQKKGSFRTTDYVREEMHRKIKLENEPTKEAKATPTDPIEVVQLPYREQWGSLAEIFRDLETYRDSELFAISLRMKSMI